LSAGCTLPATHLKAPGMPDHSHLKASGVPDHSIAIDTPWDGPRTWCWRESIIRRESSLQMMISLSKYTCHMRSLQHQVHLPLAKCASHLPSAGKRAQRVDTNLSLQMMGPLLEREACLWRHASDAIADSGLKGLTGHPLQCHELQCLNHATSN
jgi:hypothetical protein